MAAVAQPRARPPTRAYLARLAAEEEAAAEEARLQREREAQPAPPTQPARPIPDRFECRFCYNTTRTNTKHWHCPGCWDALHVYNGICGVCVRKGCDTFIGEYQNNGPYARRAVVKCGTCQTEMTPSEAQKILAKAKYREYVDSLSSLAVKTMDDIIYCPGVDCEAVYVKAVERKRCRKAHCDECETDLCGYCGELYTKEHQRMDCDRYKRWKQTHDEDLVALTRWREREDVDTKNCPQCKVPIQRAQGCRAVACTHCKFGFCWICLNAYQQCRCY